MPRNTLFERNGLHVLVDGQFGSTGKGALSAWLAHRNAEYTNTDWGGVVSNAGPNSGHTFYHNGEKHVLKQLPTFAVASHLLGVHMPILLSAGAIIDPDILLTEIQRYPGIEVHVHPNAAVITEHDRYSEADPAGTIAAVAGTRSGTGMALARKIMRDPDAIAIRNEKLFGLVAAYELDPYRDRYFVEVSQGFSLGINQQFYPKCTSRECTVAQAVTDAGMPPRSVVKTYMSLRTYPIRVGNVDGHSSGEWYYDQEETSWEELGVEAGRTTVTNRIRRVATFSDEQYRLALCANDPDFVFINFLNYLKEEDQHRFVEKIKWWAGGTPRHFDVIGGYGPKPEDVRWE